MIVLASYDVNIVFMNSATDFPKLCQTNVNLLTGGIVAEVFAQLGVRAAVVAPGSRSAPLTISLSVHSEIEAIPVLDERSAGFFALGLAKKSGTPVLLVCTSGTAAANFYPAIAEASLSNVPLIVITADRPHELRGCHTRQAIDQVKMYGSFIRWTHEFAVPELSHGYFRYFRQTLIQAYERAYYGHPGPVHLNFPLKEPLAPIEDAQCTDFLKHFNFEKFFNSVVAVPASSLFVEEVFGEKVKKELLVYKKGLIIVGQYQPKSTDDANQFSHAVLKIQKALQWPVLADAHNPLRNQAESKTQCITQYEAILRNKELCKELVPEGIVCIGPFPTSKSLRRWADNLDVPTWIIEPTPENIDDRHQRSVHLRVGVEGFANIFESTEKSQGSSYKQWWDQLEVLAQGKLNETMASVEELFEGKVPWVLSQVLPAKSSVFVSSSMPLRDFEFFWLKNDRGYQAYFNRGTNGIDGILSTALGVSHGQSEETFLVTGDLSLLHDTNGFLIQNKIKGRLTIIVINNNGGRVFENLPFASTDVDFENYFSTPQAVDFKDLAKVYRVEYHRPRIWEDFENIIKKSSSEGIRLIEVITESAHDVPYRQKLLNTISETLTAK